MQKHYSLLLAFLVAVSSLFVSCDENDNDLNPTICKITVVSDGDGTVSITNYIGTSANALIGNQVEVVATPAEGSAFIGWYVGGSTIPVSTDKRFVFTASENITLIAKFTKLSNLTLCSSGNGSVSFKDSSETSVAVLPGSEVTVVATPDAGCDFIGWFIGEAEEPVSIDAEYTFTVTENLTLTAKFSKRPVVAVRSSGNGSVSFKDSSETSVAVLPGSEVTVVATPDAGCDFIGWFIGDGDTPVSTDAEYTFAVKENITLTAKFKFRTNPNGHEYVDLGLSVKWATMNVGATSPEDYGGYYAWGETSPKSSYDSDNSVTDGLSYSELKSRGIIGSDGNLTAEYDAARANWGGSWRMPTLDELKELLNKCTWNWTTQNGVNGYKVTGPNDNSIFVPAAGYRYGTSLYDAGSHGYYWSSTPYERYSDLAYYLYFLSYNYDWGDWYGSYRFLGRSVRPVLE